jgi:hypothetical protein
MTKQRPAVNVGVDVGKAQLDLYLLEREQAISIPNDEQAIASLLRRLVRYRLERIVIEATGRLEQTFVRAALSKGLPIVVVSPLKIRRFAGAPSVSSPRPIRSMPVSSLSSPRPSNLSLDPPPVTTPSSSRTWSFAVVSSPHFAPWRKTADRSCPKL